MKRVPLPGFRLALGATAAWLGLIVVIPLAALAFVAASNSAEGFWSTAFSPRAIAAYQLTFGVALGAAIVNAFLGLLLAWILVRYSFPGKKLVDALIDIPFALPTAITGLAFATLYTSTLGSGRFAIVVVLTFISLPFVVRTLQPVLEDLGTDAEEAALSLGASRWQTFRLIILPSILPALLTGVALAFARSIGEYGSVIFVSGNIPFESEIASLLIVGQLEQFKYAGAAAIAVVLLAASFALNGVINLLAQWSRRHA
jgi:sulfate transport system permease protein